LQRTACLTPSDPRTMPDAHSEASGIVRRAHRSTCQTDAMESLELPLTTERLRLPPHRISDAEALLPIHSREDVARYLLKDPWTAEAAETEIVKRLPRTGLATESRALALVRSEERRVGNARRAARR